MKEKPIIRVTVWKHSTNHSISIERQKDFRTFQAAENFAKKWGEKEDEGVGFYDPELSWNDAANRLLEKKGDKA